MTVANHSQELEPGAKYYGYKCAISHRVDVKILRKKLLNEVGSLYEQGGICIIWFLRVRYFKTSLDISCHWLNNVI